MDWVANVGVVSSYDRTDLDHHAAEVATALGLTGPGATLFTAVDVARVVTACDGGVRVDATVGVTRPVWAAAPSTTDDTATPGTINLVIQVPATITAAAGVNAVVTATEAKTQALVEYGIDGSGTASDAVAVCWPSAGTAVRFAGPRSTLGAAIARAVHRAVCDGLDPGPHP